MTLVLVVDDIQLERRRVGEVLRKEGLAFAEASNGVEALELVETLRPDMVLTDLMMPQMDGVAFLAEMRRRRINIPTVVITSDAQEETRCECIGLGAVSVLIKPWDEADLVRLIRRLANVRADGTG